MNFSLKNKLWLAKTQAEHMFVEQPWFVSADIEVNGPQNTFFILIGLDRTNADSTRLMETMGKMKVGMVPLKPVLVDRP